MSPDEPAVAAFVVAAQRRARWIAIIEAAGWALGGAGAAAGAALALRAASMVALGASALTALAVAVTCVVGRWRLRTARSAVVRRIERVTPGLRNLLVTAEELTSETSAEPASVPRLQASSQVRARVFADAARALGAADPRAAAAASPAIRAVAISAGMWLMVAGGFAATRGARAIPVSSASIPAAGRLRAAAAGGTLHVTATVQPPDYTGLPAQTLVDPAQVQAVEGSALTLEIAASGDRVVVEHDGASRTLARGAADRFSDRLLLAKTGFLVVSSGEAASASCRWSSRPMRCRWCGSRRRAAI